MVKKLDIIEDELLSLKSQIRVPQATVCTLIGELQMKKVISTDLFDKDVDEIMEYIEKDNNDLRV